MKFWQTLGSLGVLVFLLDICVVLILFAGAAMDWAEQNVSALRVVSDLALLLVFLFPGLVGGVVYLWSRARVKALEQQHRDQRERLLGMVRAHAQLPFQEILRTLGMNRQEALSLLYELIGEGKFSGYVDWSTETLYTYPAVETEYTHCPNCGAPLEAVGYGVVKCPYCGATLFLAEKKASQDAADEVPS